jgi:hypothetical protein
MSQPFWSGVFPAITTQRKNHFFLLLLSVGVMLVNGCLPGPIAPKIVTNAYTVSPESNQLSLDATEANFLRIVDNYATNHNLEPMVSSHPEQHQFRYGFGIAGGLMLSTDCRQVPFEMSFGQRPASPITGFNDANWRLAKDLRTELEHNGFQLKKIKSKR